MPNAHTDFIFAIIGEELGLLGTLSILLLFVAFAYAGVRVAQRAPDPFGRYLAGGVTVWIVVQALVNIGAVVGVLPITGVPLPLVSFGGSSMLVLLAATGMLLNVARHEVWSVRASVIATTTRPRPSAGAAAPPAGPSRPAARGARPRCGPPPGAAPTARPRPRRPRPTPSGPRGARQEGSQDDRPGSGRAAGARGPARPVAAGRRRRLRGPRVPRAGPGPHRRPPRPGGDRPLRRHVQGLETRVVPEAGFALDLLPILPLSRRLAPETLLAPFAAVNGTFAARRLLREHHFDVVCGMGGYVTLPVAVAARLEGVPVVLHEQNAVPGIANRLAARVASRIAVGVDAAAAAFPPDRTTVVGNPVRPELARLDRAALHDEALAAFGLDPERRTLFVFGGSQGARHVNQAVVAATAHWPIPPPSRSCTPAGGGTRPTSGRPGPRPTPTAGGCWSRSSPSSTAWTWPMPPPTWP